MTQINQVFKIDGVDQTFSSKAEATNYLRLPMVRAALLAVTGNNGELADWLLSHQETIEIAFETGAIRRVTKAESAKLAKAIEALKTRLGDNNKDIAFLVENASAILDSFRWPSVKRMDETEKNTAARNTLAAAADGDEAVANWILANKDAVLAAYSAGAPKREVSSKATEALNAYRVKKAAEKARQDAYVAEQVGAGVEESAAVNAFKQILVQEAAALAAASAEA